MALAGSAGFDLIFVARLGFGRFKCLFQELFRNKGSIPENPWELCFKFMWL